MDIQRLRVELDNRKIPKDAYTLSTAPKDETLVLERRKNNWCVYYYERGLRTDENFFSLEDEACEHFLSRISAWFRKASYFV